MEQKETIKIFPYYRRVTSHKGQYLFSVIDCFDMNKVERLRFEKVYTNRIITLQKNNYLKIEAHRLILCVYI